MTSNTPEDAIFSPAIFHASPVAARHQLNAIMDRIPCVAGQLSEIGEDLAAEARSHTRATYGWAGWLSVAKKLQAVAAATAKRTQRKVYLTLRAEGVPVEDAKAMAEVSDLVEEAQNEHVVLSEYVDRITNFLESGRTRRAMLQELFTQYRHDDH